MVASRGTMDLINLKRIYSELDSLIKSEKQLEDNYQKFFENNTEVFTFLGYNSPISHPKLLKYDGTKYFPDFLVKDLSGNWVIFELKRPDTKANQNHTSRNTFYKSFETYISQCNEYSLYFEDRENRNYVKKNLNIDVQAQVKSILVSSVSSNVDKNWINDELIRNRSARLSLLTLDDILAAIHAHIKLHEQHLSHLDGLSGSIFFSPVNDGNKNDNFLVSFGKTPQNCISIGYSYDHFFVHITHNGDTTKANTSFTFQCDKIYNVHFEIGLDNNFTLVSININGDPLNMRIFDPLHSEIDDLYNWIIGSDITGKTNSSYSLMELILYSRTLTYEEQLAIDKFLNEKYEIYLSPLVPSLPHRVNFIGNKFMTSAGHPLSTDKDYKRTIKKGLLVHYNTSGVQLASGRAPKPDPLLRPSSINLPT